ncbi:type IX secretion system outer membrane channel protein PorV [Galbibacter sp. EGI 63066]|uniref:type IX secretion system outer membrane channel protein PorV n=1 Tax=Galbibacter sp. EGI 63066 TaxID=2993559 RepID=UPI002249712A|nr:type IX secretion system outer membrane channel protein PorV [Galbibacter sp. EGI 63066]MCX2679665.1 type IX secretion system outer membrane channel protein PorV [Galbibacter sp. EGI 63066]
MKINYLLLGILFLSNLLRAQEDSRMITTAVPFLAIASDAKAGGMGELGATTTPDVYSQQWNPAKYTFATRQIGVGISYTPYLSKLVNDIALLNATYYNRVSERSAWAASFRYFSLGDIEFITENEALQGLQPIIERPNELALDVSYSLRLSQNYSMAVVVRYLRSDLKIRDENIDASAASSFAVDVAGYFQSNEIAYENFNGRWKGGFNISNVGPKIKYDAEGRESYLPTNLKLGGGFDFLFDIQNKLSLDAEFNKLLVPTPSDSNGDGEINTEDDYYTQSFFKGMFSSFGDAPDGFSEELKEITWALGAEYMYNDAFALRTGYFHESDEKGARKFFTLGAGFRFKATSIDFSYLFSTSRVRNPLENTLRFSLTFNLGDEYSDY